MKISIIVPVYNVAKYLRKCVDSLLAQTESDIEVILIDDCSPDESPAICDEYAKLDNRVIVYHQLHNQGVSIARNKGIELATGPYLTFVDSDDYIATDYIESLVACLDDDIDLVLSGLTFFEDQSNSVLGREILADYTRLQRCIPSDCYTLATMPLITSPVAKLYRRDIIINNDIRFDKQLSYGEDRDFNLSYIGFVKEATTVNYAGYYYRKGLPNSLSTSSDSLQLLKWDIYYWSKLKTYFIDNNCYDNNTITYLANRLFNFYNDRLLQFVKAERPNFRMLIGIISIYVTNEDFNWLCEHICTVYCNKIVKWIYKSQSAFAIASYVKFL